MITLDEVERRLARTYDHPSYDDSYEVVKDYRRVERVAADHPNKGSAALASMLNLPRGRIRSWVDSDGMPDPARAISTARNKGWLDPTQPMATLIGHVLGGGAITTDTYVPSVAEGRRVTVPDIEQAFRSVDVRTRRRNEGSDSRATEVVPRTDGSILGRTLVAWGCPAGGRKDITTLPALVDHVALPGKRGFLTAYVHHRAVNYHDKATSRVQGEQPLAFHQAIADLIETVTHKDATAGSRGVTVSAAAMRALQLDE